MTKAELSKAFAAKFIERSETLGYKGLKRDNAALDFYCGACAALQLLDGVPSGEEPALVQMFGTQAVLLISVRGYVAVKELAQ